MSLNNSSENKKNDAPGGLGVSMLKGLNHLFPKQVHPFNMRNDGGKSYAEWQFDMGERTIEFYMEGFTTDEMFRDKTVLDMGCGAAGKSLYYAGLGAKKVVGVDMVEVYRPEAEALAEKLGFAEVFEFISGDATKLPLPDKSFDTIVMNDFMEHVGDPEACLRESFRLLKEGGRIYTNFPPYYHPFGAHLSDEIGIPWVHMFFTEKTMVRTYKQLVTGLPDEKERLDLRISKNAAGVETFSYINHMTIKHFKKILGELKLTPVYYREAPLRGFLKPLAVSPLKEMFVKMVVCVLEKPKES